MYDYEIRNLMLKGLAEIWVRLRVCTFGAMGVGQAGADMLPIKSGDPWPGHITAHVTFEPSTDAPQWHENGDECSLESTDANGNATTWCHIYRDPETRAFHWEVALERTHEGEADSLELAQLCGVATILRWLPGEKTP